MVVPKRERKEKPANRTKEGPRTCVRTSGKTDSPPGCPIYIRQAQGEEKKHIQRGAKTELGASLCVFWVSLPSSLEGVFSFACQIKLSCNTGLSITSNFCCGKTKLRKLQTTLRAGTNSYIVITMQILDIDFKNCARTPLKSVLIRVL